jgi:hypothetical protein
MLTGIWKSIAQWRRDVPAHKMSENDMFHTREEILIDAYRIHGEQIAYQDEAMLQEELREGAKQ